MNDETRQLVRERWEARAAANPDDAAARVELGRLLFASAERTAAAGWLLSGARLHMRQGRLPLAIGACRELLRNAPGNSDAQLLLAQLYARTPDGAGARIATPAESAPIIDLTQDSRIIELETLEGLEAVPAELAEPAPERAYRPDVLPRAKKFRGNNLGPADLYLSPDELPDVQLFRSFSAAAIAELLRHVPLVEYQANDVIVPENGEGRALYIIVKGSVRPERGGGEEGGDPLLPLVAGEFFGEFELLSGLRTRATVRACETTRTLEMDREIVDLLGQSDPGIWENLWSIYTRRLLDSLLGTSPIFAPLTQVDRDHLAGRFDRIDVPSGRHVTRQGEITEGVYLVVDGDLEIVHRDTDSVVRSYGRLRPGDFFGFTSALLARPSESTVTARADARLLMLRRAHLQRLLGDHPEVAVAAGAELARQQGLVLGIHVVGGVGGLSTRYARDGAG